jgi:poly-gamma-glutamate capsule biosynthesis protein CapA/YwtB (metallophosphatase superfamily)
MTLPAETVTKTIFAVGDVNPCRDLARSLLAQDLNQKRQELAGLFAGADLVLGNLEGPVTDRPQCRPGQVWNLNVPPALSPILSLFNGFTLANNHMFDFGPEGFVDTVNVLDKQGIKYCGAGLNSEEACRPAVFNLDGFMVSMIGITDRNWHPSSTDKPGTAIWNDRETAGIIRDLAEKTDFVIVQVHQGYEFVDYPGPEELDVAAKAVKAGADLVLGHHSHYIMGIARKGTSAIAYGLGDFLLDKKHIPQPYREKARECALFRFTITNHEVMDWSISPCYSDQYGWPAPAGSRQAALMHEHFNELSRTLDDEKMTLSNFRSQAGRNMLPYALRLLAHIFRHEGPLAALERLSRIRPVDLSVMFSHGYRLIKRKIAR